MIARRYCHERSRLMVVALWALTACCFIANYLSSAAATTLPYQKPLVLGAESLVEMEVKIERHRIYHLDLLFPFYDEKQREVAKDLVGEPTHLCEQLSKCGLKVSFEVLIEGNNYGPAMTNKKTLGSYAFNDKFYYRRVSNFNLRPGLYKIKVRTMSIDNSESPINAFLEFSTDVRAADLED